MNRFGSRSLNVLKGLHPDLRKVMELAIQRSNVDFGLHEGARTVETQQEYFDNGKSKVNPKAYSSVEELAEKGKHIVIAGHPQYEYSRAVDLHSAESHNGKSLAWDTVHLSFIAGVITSCAKELYEKGEITHIVRWGLDWDRDGVIGLDQALDDGPHFELIKP